MTDTKHPAKFSDPILEVIAEECQNLRGVLLDPFAGTGKVHQLQTRKLHTMGIEIEPEWAEMHPRTVVGNALHLPFPDGSIDAIATSPCYGNRMADHHDARDDSKRNTYTHTLGRKLHPDNSGAMQWGEQYRRFHLLAWLETQRVLRQSRSTARTGRLILNTSNHIRDGEEVDVTGWHTRALETLGYTLLSVRTVDTTRNREGANAHLRCDHETVQVFAR